MSSSANTAIILLVTVLLLLAGGGAFAYMSQDDENAGTNGVVVLPPDPNLRLSSDYPVNTDPDTANKDCSVEQAVYKNAEGACYDSSGNVMTGLNNSCGRGTTTRILDTELSVGFVAAQGTGTCDILQDDAGECEVPCPSDCEGGRWIEGQSCVRKYEDGEEVALFDGGRLSKGECGPGQTVNVRNPNTDDFKPAVGTGTCVYYESKPCYKTCTDDQGREIDAEFVGVCGYTGIETLDRDIGSTVFGHEGCVKMDENGEPVKDTSGKYIEVGEGEEGRARWFKPVTYGDSTKCKNLVSWKKCQGPNKPTDCVGGWLDQQESVEGDQKWSACYLRMDPETGLKPVHGETYRKKEYHISQHASEALPGGGRAGAPCFAEVELEGGKTERRQFDSDDAKVFEQQCPQTQWVDECVKTPWVLDTNRGADTGYCALDENGENPTKKYTRSVTGACGPDYETKSDRFFREPYDPDDPNGNDEEKFEGCCYKTDWINDPERTVAEGNQPQIRTVKNCTAGSDPDDPDGASGSRNLKVCHVEDPNWTTKTKAKDASGNELKCKPTGYETFTRKVHNPELCRPDVDTSTELHEECCYRSEYEKTDTCQDNGKWLETRTVRDGPANGSGLCGQDIATTQDGDDCCKISHEIVDRGDAGCEATGYQKKQYKHVGNCEALGQSVIASDEQCCYIPKDADGNEAWGEWSTVSGETCEGTGSEGIAWMERSRTVGQFCDPDNVKTYEKKQRACERPTCATGYTGSGIGFHPDSFMGKSGEMWALAERPGQYRVAREDMDPVGWPVRAAEATYDELEWCKKKCDDMDGCAGFEMFIRAHHQHGGILFCNLFNDIKPQEPLGGYLFCGERKTNWRKNTAGEHPKLEDVGCTFRGAAYENDWAKPYDTCIDGHWTGPKG